MLPSHDSSACRSVEALGMIRIHCTEVISSAPHDKRQLRSEFSINSFDPFSFQRVFPFAVPIKAIGSFNSVTSSPLSAESERRFQAQKLGASP